jgi:N6-adenosine-specific RNA methylase IME4
MTLDQIICGDNAPDRELERGAGVGGVLKTLGEAQTLYGVIYADPPWSYDNAGPQGGVGAEYVTMTDEEICALKIPAAKDCVLYMWATMPRLPLALDVIKAWGFTYKTGACWDKLRLGIGYWFRGQHELLLVGVRGKVSPPKVEDRIRSVLRCKSGRHSAKPDQVRDHIAKVFPDVPKLEMFARRKTVGWDAFGNQVEHDLLSGPLGGGGRGVEICHKRLAQNVLKLEDVK